jgi:hypothetical protein
LHGCASERPPAYCRVTVHEPVESDIRAGTDRRFALIGTTAFACCVVALSTVHEPWRDETQAWRLAIDSDGIVALAQNARYEGHPLLFYLLLQLVGHLSRAWWAAVALHVAIAAAGAWVVLRHAPFTRAERVLVVAGYFPLYEYAVVVRAYGLGMLLGFTACLAWTVQRARWAWAAVVLMANTSAFGLVLAVAAALGFATEGWVRRRPRRWAVGGLALATAGVVTIALQAHRGTLSQMVYFMAVADRWDAGRMVDLAAIPLRALTPLAEVRDGGVVWGTWFDSDGGSRRRLAQALVSMGIVAIGALIAARRRTALVFYLAATGGLLASFIMIRYGHLRHFGYFAVAWIMSAWLAWAGPPSAWPTWLERHRPGLERAVRWCFTASLVPMVLAAGQMAYADWRQQFSDAERLARALTLPPLAGLPIVALSRPQAQTVAALTGRPIYMALEGRSGTFVNWDWGLETAETGPPAVDMALAGPFSGACQVLVLSIPGLDPSPAVRARARVVYETNGLVMAPERYRVWLVTAPPSTACPPRSPSPG